METTALALLLLGCIRTFETIAYDRGRKRGEVIAKWTVLAMGVNFGVLVLATIAEYLVFEREVHLLLTACALCVLAARSAIKYLSFRALGRMYSSDIEIREGHRLVRSGPYRYVRHPVYLANLLEFFAFPLLVGSFYVLAVVFPIQLAMILTRISLEEKALEKKFGSEYREYKENTGSLFPRISRKQERKNEDTAYPAAV